MTTWVYDTETLPNRTLLSAKCVETGEWFDVWRHESNAVDKLKSFLEHGKKTLVGFNRIYLQM